MIFAAIFLTLFACIAFEMRLEHLGWTLITGATILLIGLI